MRYTCRLILGLAVFAAASGVVLAQEPNPTPLPPLPEAVPTPAPVPPTTDPTREPTSATAVPSATPTKVIGVDTLVVAAPMPPQHKGTASATARQNAKTAASKKPAAKPASETESQDKAAEAAAIAAAGGTSPAPPLPPAAVGGATSPGSEPGRKPAPPDTNAARAQSSVRSTEPAHRSSNGLNWIFAGAVVVLAIGIVTFVVRHRATGKLPTMADSGMFTHPSPAQPGPPLLSGRRL